MTRAVVVITSRSMRERVAAWAEKAPAGTRVEFKAPRRSLPQNDRMWAMLTDVSEQATWNGDVLTPTEWKDMFTAAVKIASDPHSVRAVQGLEGGLMLLGLHTSDMSTAEMTELLDYIEAWGVQHGVEFHDGQRLGGAKNPAQLAA